MAKLINGKTKAEEKKGNGKGSAAQAVWRAQFDAAAKLPGANDRTLSDHPLKPMYGPEDLDGIEYERDLVLSGLVSVHARHPSDDVSQPAVDDASVRRLRHRETDQRAL